MLLKFSSFLFILYSSLLVHFSFIHSFISFPTSFSFVLWYLDAFITMLQKYLRHVRPSVRPSVSYSNSWTTERIFMHFDAEWFCLFHIGQQCGHFVWRPTRVSAHGSGLGRCVTRHHSRNHVGGDPHDSIITWPVTFHKPHRRKDHWPHTTLTSLAPFSKVKVHILTEQTAF
jgi:hypothetical protein